MARASQLLDRIDRAIVSFPAITSSIAGRKEREIRGVQIEQLLDGRSNTGDYLSPTILDDPYFEGDRLKAWKYAEMKARLYPDTPFGIPNLTIVGYYHSTISVNVQGQELIFDGGTKMGPSIAAKYHNTHLGLSPASKKIVYIDIIRQPLRESIKDIIYNKQ